MGTRDAVDWCTSIPLDTPLARLVTADPGTEMIDMISCVCTNRSGLSSTRAADAIISA